MVPSFLTPSFAISQHFFHGKAENHGTRIMGFFEYFVLGLLQPCMYKFHSALRLKVIVEMFREMINQFSHLSLLIF